MQIQTRRSFYSSVFQGLGSIIGVALAVPSLIYLLIGPKSRRRGDWVEATDLTQLQIGKPKEVTFERLRVDGWRTFQEKVIAWVVRPNEKDVIAYSPQCTHLGCAYHWEDQQNRFICPCHSSMFSMDGQVIQGPAARPLDRYQVRVEDEKLLIGPQIQKS